MPLPRELEDQFNAQAPLARQEFHDHWNLGESLTSEIGGANGAVSAARRGLLPGLLRAQPAADSFLAELLEEAVSEWVGHDRNGWRSTTPRLSGWGQHRRPKLFLDAIWRVVPKAVEELALFSAITPGKPNRARFLLDVDIEEAFSRWAEQWGLMDTWLKRHARTCQNMADAPAITWGRHWRELPVAGLPILRDYMGRRRKGDSGRSAHGSRVALPSTPTAAN